MAKLVIEKGDVLESSVLPGIWCFYKRLNNPKDYKFARGMLEDHDVTIGWRLVRDGLVVATVEVPAPPATPVTPEPPSAGVTGTGDVYQVMRRTVGAGTNNRVQWWVVRDGLTVAKYASRVDAETDAAVRNRDWNSAP